MARKITDYDGGSLPVSGTNPYGALDDGSTIVNAKANDDIQVFFQRAMALSGITPNSLPDNTVNGFQLATAVGLGQWVDLGTTLTYGQDSGTITIQPSDILYNRYRLQGRTFEWQIHIRQASIAGAASILWIELPSAIGTTLGLTFANDLGEQFSSVYTAQEALMSTLNVSGGFGANKILFNRAGGVAFTNGTNNQVFSLNVVCELI